MSARSTEDRPDVDLDQVYSYAEAAAIIGGGTTARMVRRWCDDGRIGYVNMPRGRRIRLRHIHAFLEDRDVAPLDA